MKFLDELASRRRFGMKPGLGTIRALCAALGNPERQFPSVHVAGTDGKGAVCAMLDACLRTMTGCQTEDGLATSPSGFAARSFSPRSSCGQTEDGLATSPSGFAQRSSSTRSSCGQTEDGLATSPSGFAARSFSPRSSCSQTVPGLAVGRYTSPHLVRLNERFFLDGAPVSDADLERIAAPVFTTIANLEQKEKLEVTFFEALTAVAFSLYEQKRVDVAVMECGLGGRLDATNVCNSVLSVITRIGLDHCDWLGDTVEKIAAEKAGIIRPGVPVVLGENEPSVRAVVESRAHELGAPFYYAPDLASDADIPAVFSLVGAFNRENAVTAIAALRVFVASSCGQSIFGLLCAPDRGRSGYNAFRILLDGLSNVVWPGRFQRIGDFIVDGAHNPPAARALAESLDSPCQLIAGFCGDKDVDRVLRILAPRIRGAFAVKTNNPRSLAAGETARRMRSAGMDAEECSSLREAIARAGAAARKSGLPTLVCGSLFLAGEAIVELGAYPWPLPVTTDPSELLAPSSAATS